MLLPILAEFSAETHTEAEIEGEKIITSSRSAAAEDSEVVNYFTEGGARGG